MKKFHVVGIIVLSLLLSINNTYAQLTKEDLQIHNKAEKLKEHYFNAYGIEKPDIPIDPRPTPGTLDDWDKIKKMPDPLGEMDVSSAGLFSKVSPRANFNFGNIESFSWGDIILGAIPADPNKKLDNLPYGFFRHAGMFHARSDVFISAWPKEGVRRESKGWWKSSYKVTVGLKVSKVILERKEKACEYALSQLGKPYLIGANLYGDKTWYCSKIPFRAYLKHAFVFIEHKAKYFVSPDDLYKDRHTEIFFKKNFRGLGVKT